MDLLRLHSVGIAVDDLDTVVDFFVALGFEFYVDSLLDGEWLDSVLGFEGARVNVIQLVSPMGDSRIEFIKHEPPVQVQPVADPRTVRAGQVRIIGLQVENLDEALEHAYSIGAHPVGKGTQVLGDYRIAYVLAPENILLMIGQDIGWGHSAEAGDQSA
jgi:catechol 2,3-dioxygenase-like lactoylglutathione lyase family enzyme